MKEASLVCGTWSEQPWLLRSRPDQVSRAPMRRGPPGWIVPHHSRLIAFFLLSCGQEGVSIVIKTPLSGARGTFLHLNTAPCIFQDDLN
jgi:hypothetical protein